MEIRLPQHEISRALTYVRAIQHQPEMSGLHMFASHFKAVAERGAQTNIVALLTGIDTGLHLSGSDLLHDNLQFCAIRESAACFDTQVIFFVSNSVADLPLQLYATSMPVSAIEPLLDLQNEAHGSCIGTIFLHAPSMQGTLKYDAGNSRHRLRHLQRAYSSVSKLPSVLSKASVASAMH
jgi:hypothetical protein